MCDTGDVHRPAAGQLVQWFANDGGHDESRVKEGSHLLMEWTKEGMAAQAGTCRTPRPTSPELSSAEAAGRAVPPRRTSSAAAGSNYPHLGEFLLRCDQVARRRRSRGGHATHHRGPPRRPGGRPVDCTNGEVWAGQVTLDSGCRCTRCERTRGGPQPAEARGAEGRSVGGDG
ncbi:DUF6300 family protein [Streptomyces sp. NPDC056704]|uniref:DUF6300 family protein n=1 Tax=Streptomyces sp. NPDC056704 TaxID=3345917 RepID=UPI0036BD26E6